MIMTENLKRESDSKLKVWEKGLYLTVLIHTCMLYIVRVIKSRRDGLGMWRVWVRGGGCTGSWWGNWREGDHWGDPGIDGQIILRWVSRKWDVCIATGLGWARIDTGGGRL